MFLFQEKMGKPAYVDTPKSSQLPKEIQEYRTLVERKATEFLSQKIHIKKEDIIFNWGDYDRLKISVPKYNAASSGWNYPYELQEKFLPREINGAIKEKYGEDYKSFKILSDKTMKKDGTYLFIYIIPEKMRDPSKKPPEKGFWEKIFEN
ncbi:MAG: hypothetical protein QW568_03070 [Candidatus Anstonellaceae archaeon]